MIRKFYTDYNIDCGDHYDDDDIGDDDDEYDHDDNDEEVILSSWLIISRRTLQVLLDHGCRAFVNRVLQCGLGGQKLYIGEKENF